MIIDLESKNDYVAFLKQVKEIGITDFRYHFILTYMVIYFYYKYCLINSILKINIKSVDELNLDEFRHGGVRITAFSIIDYNINTIKLMSDLIQDGKPLNKIVSIPVRNIFC